MVVRLYSIIQNQAKLPNIIKVVKGEEDNLTKPVNSVIKARNRDVIKLTKKARLCLSGLAKKTFVSNKDNKSKIEFI
jgi:hypothetical protein